MFFPSHDATTANHPDLLATSGNFLRMLEIHDDRIALKSLLNNNKSSEFNSSLTSFDLADFDVHHMATSSVDTTCAIWDIATETLDTKLVVHDKQVYDISWGGFNIFALVSGDGSLRIFDLREKDRSTIVYENPIQGCPLLRLEWNKRDPELLATVGLDSNKVVILDIRNVSDETQNRAQPQLEPDMWYNRSMAEINNARWSPIDLNWIAIAFLNKFQVLNV
ncbi:hypothetical protein Tsubulata_001306 [Turnera subulata]|uniref:Peroxin-7 n=1 Tax=Turnera subulata TaxID=218843 RepID=A0A9Q0FG58_9ROSI|nr:hypothetical protein Tsubulata_001306 [Turnera subulata]